MRGVDHHNDRLFSYVRPDSRVPADHPLRAIRKITDAALASLSDRFDALYSAIGRPSIPPEKLLRALLLQAFYSVRSERQLMEQMNYNLLFRWFVGLSVGEPVWVPTVFSHNRDPAARRRHRGRIHGSGAEPAGTRRPALDGAFFSRRNTGQGLGIDEEFPPPRWQR